MAYDDAAKKVAIKAIGTVETGMKYDSINYADPITVGLTQWYGPRASAILRRMKTENAGAWNGVASSLDNDLSSHGDTSWWTGRYLTRDEGASIKPVLLANKAIQDDQTIKDLQDYVELAERWGMDKDANTKAMIFFFVMYHQSPKRARNILNAAGPDSSMARLRSFCLNEPVLGKYKTRYNTAYQIIDSMDSSGVDGPAESTGSDEEGNADDGAEGGVRATGDVNYLQVVGDNIAIVDKSGNRVFAYPNGSGVWMPGLDQNKGDEPAPDDSGHSGQDSQTPPDAETSTGDMPADAAEKAKKLVA